MERTASKKKGKKPVNPPLQAGQQPKRAAKSSKGKKSKKAPGNPNVNSLQSNTAGPSAPPLKDVIKSMIFEPSTPSLELLEPPPPLTEDEKAKLNNEILQIIKEEDEKYDIDFDVPPAVWSQKDRSKMRVIIRTMSMEHKRYVEQQRVRQIGHEVRNSGPVEIRLARDIIGLLQKDMNLLRYLTLQNLAHSTFSNKTYDWIEVSELMDDKYTPAECEEFWFMKLYPQIKNMPFNPDIEEQLLELASANNYTNWDFISENIIGPSEYQCYVHFRRNLLQKVLHPLSEQTINTPADDDNCSYVELI